MALEIDLRPLQQHQGSLAQVFLLLLKGSDQVGSLSREINEEK